AAVHAAADLGRLPQNEIGLGEASRRARGCQGIRARGIAAIEGERSRAAVVAGIERVDSLALALKPEVKRVGALRDAHRVFVLNDGVGEKLINVGVAD